MKPSLGMAAPASDADQAREALVAVVVERAGATSLPRPGRFSALVVAGHSGARESVARTLRGLGAREVVVAAGALEGRLRARAMGPRELCVAEVGLPDGSGIGLLHDLKTQGWARTVVISATADPYTVRAALAAGVRALVVAGRAPAAPAARPSRLRGPLGPRDRGPPAGRRRPVQQGDRHGARPVRADREEPPGPDRPQARHR